MRTRWCLYQDAFLLLLLTPSLTEGLKIALVTKSLISLEIQSSLNISVFIKLSLSLSLSLHCDEQVKGEGSSGEIFLVNALTD